MHSARRFSDQNTAGDTEMTDRTPIGNPDSLQRARFRHAPPESAHLGETGAHVPKQFPDTEREPELEPPFELPPKKPAGLSREKAEGKEPGGSGD